MKNILIVDDDQAFVQTMTASFDPARYAVVKAVDGEEGLKKMETFKPDIVLLDIMMPKMSGIDFLKLMNQKYASDKIPVVMLTNLSSIQTIGQGVELGIRAYILKSTESVAGIVSAVERILESSK